MRVRLRIGERGDTFIVYWLFLVIAGLVVLVNHISYGSDGSFYLSFPLKDYTPYSAPISSVFDHSMVKDKNGSIQRNNGNKVVEAYTAEIGDDKANTTDSPGYSNKDGTDFFSK